MRDLHLMPDQPSIQDAMAVAIRHIARSVDLHSRWLVEEHGLTGPQIATLRAACRLGRASSGELARAVELSQPTITGILDRLERKGLVVRCRGERDRRSIHVTLTPEGVRAVDAVPSVLHQRFRHELAKLPEWEQTMMLAVLQRVVSMMSIERLEGFPRIPTELPELCPSGEQEASLAGPAD